MSSTSVAVIGAGIGGLTTALALQQRGYGVRVYEQAGQLGEIGAGVHLSPNGMKVLQALGLGPALGRVAARPQAIVTRHFATGRANFEGPLDAAFEARFGAPFCSFHRADLHAILAQAVQAADPAAIVLGRRARAVSEDEAGAHIDFADGTRAAAAVIVAADGVHSSVRSDGHGVSATRFTGHVAYRGMVATAALAPGLVEPKVNIWVGPGRHFVAYPVRRGELINYVALVEEAGWDDESWTTRAEHGALTSAFSGWHATVRALVGQTLAGECYKWALLGRDPLPYWSTGRTTLLGDAAHPMVPYLAQGAVMAVEDGWTLAACLAQHADTGAALKAYERARLPRTAAMQAAAWEQGRLNHAVGRDAGGDDFAGGGFADPGWIYGYDAVALFPPSA